MRQSAPLGATPRAAPAINMKVVCTDVHSWAVSRRVACCCPVSLRARCAVLRCAAAPCPATSRHSKLVFSSVSISIVLLVFLSLLIKLVSGQRAGPRPRAGPCRARLLNGGMSLQQLSAAPSILLTDYSSLFCSLQEAPAITPTAWSSLFQQLLFSIQQPPEAFGRPLCRL